MTRTVRAMGGSLLLQPERADPGAEEPVSCKRGLGVTGPGAVANCDPPVQERASVRSIHPQPRAVRTLLVQLLDPRHVGDPHQNTTIVHRDGTLQRSATSDDRGLKFATVQTRAA